MRRFMTVLLLGISLPLIAQDADHDLIRSSFAAPGGLEVYGYILEKATLLLDSKDDVGGGNSLAARFKTQWAPNQRLSVISEFKILGTFGSDNPLATARGYGLPVAPGTEEHWSMEMDHLYGQANFDAFDLSFGKLPIAWGASYVFNPTAKAYSTASLDYSSEETPGTLAIAPSLAVHPSLALSAYLAFQDKLARNTTDLAEGELRNLPWGLKATGILGSFDISLSFMKEVAYVNQTYTRRGYMGTDFTGALWNFGVYGEAALGLPDSVAQGTGTADFDLERDLEAALGFDYTFQAMELETRGEYYYQGEGATDQDEYDVSQLLSGTSSVLGRHYLFLYASRVIADYFTVTVAGLTNLGDGSWMLLPGVVWDAAADLEVNLGAYVPLGSKGSEYDGRFDLSGLGLSDADLIEPQIYGSIKLSF